jgi:hypothetical protein
VLVINNAASTLGDGFTPFFINRGVHPRLPLTSPPLSSQCRRRGRGTAALCLADARAGVDSVRALCGGQQERKARLDAGRVETRAGLTQVGGRVLLRTEELLDAVDICKLLPRWDGPLTITACPSPDTSTLALLRRMQCSPMVNVDRLKPFHEQVGTSQAPGQVLDPGQEGEHKVELLLNCKTTRGVTHYLVRWRGHTSAANEWLRVEEALRSWPTAWRGWLSTRRALQPVPRATATSHGRRPSPLLLGSPTAGSGRFPAGARDRAPGRGTGGRSRAGCRHVSRRSDFSHVVGYSSSSPHGAAEVNTLLDTAAHGTVCWWQLLLSAGQPRGASPRRGNA